MALPIRAYGICDGSKSMLFLLVWDNPPSRQ